MAEKVSGKKVSHRRALNPEEWMEMRINRIEDFLLPQVAAVDGWEIREGYYRDVEQFDFVDDGWRTIKIGERWGAANRIGFFRRKIKIPAEFAGKPVALFMQVGGESTVFINGSAVNSLDPHRSEIPLSEKARGGEIFDVMLESHVWSFPDDERTETAGDTHPFSRAEIATIDREVEAALFDFRVAYEAAAAFADNEQLNEFLMHRLDAAAKMLDRYETDPAKFKRGLKQAREYLRKEIYETDAFRAPGKLSLVAHSHLDIAFHWWIHHGARKARRTMSAQLALMEQYPEFQFCQSQPKTFEDLKIYYPEVYERVQKMVKRGSLEPIGGMWIEPDGNLPSGESFVRQILYGKRFWREEFGVDTKICWLPDVFGCAWILPQILKRSGIDYFVTHKQSTWNDTNKWPYSLFVWRGPDGSEVLGCIPPTHFIGQVKPEQLRANWEGHAQKDIVPESMCNYGWGNGGGGPTRPMLEYAKRLRRFPGLPEAEISSAEGYLSRAWKKRADLPVWEDELYLEMHRGTYTTKGILKKLNRLSEFLLRDAEAFGYLAEKMGADSMQDEINDAWKPILVNQFHDILPGSHVNEVAVFAIPVAHEARDRALALRDRAICNLASKINTEGEGIPVVVFNSLNWRRSDVVEATIETRAENISLFDSAGEEIPCQFVSRSSKEARLLFIAEDVPSMGYRAYHAVTGRAPSAAGPAGASLKVDSKRAENAFFRLRFNSQGYLTSVNDQRNGRELLVRGGVGNKFQLFEDKPGVYDAWDIVPSYREREWPVEGLESIEAVESGPLRAVLRVSRKFLESSIEQDIILYARIPRIDFVTRVDWRERQKLLKVGFPLDIHTAEATCDLDYGTIQRPTHRNTAWDQAKFEFCAHKWADISEQGYGVSLMNDCKYGYDVERLAPDGPDGNLMRLTLLKGSVYPDETSDLGEHEFTYSLYPHSGDWRQGGTVRQSYHLNIPLKAVVVEPRGGKLPVEAELISIDADNVVIGAVKRAEDSGEMVIRLIEMHGLRRKVKVALPEEPVAVSECNLMEDAERKVRPTRNGFSFEMRPNEIRTFRVSFGK